VEIVKSVVGLSTQLNVVDSEADAIEYVAQKTPDVIILDLMLRKGNGFGVLRKLEKQEKAPRKPKVIVLTNYALPKYRDMALLMGADYFLDKALSMDSLPPIIESIALDSMQLLPDKSSDPDPPS
jgi:two-component system response regulator (stage 0 sporulation protein A)